MGDQRRDGNPMRRALLALALLAGCRRPMACPEPPVVPNPQLRIHQLTPSSTIPQVLEAYALDLAEICGQRDQLQVILSAYRRKQ